MTEIDYRYQKTVSYSQYSLFNQCPHQWYLKYVKKLKDDTPQNIFTENNVQALSSFTERAASLRCVLEDLIY
jgi:hypothetical protein